MRLLRSYWKLEILGTFGAGRYDYAHVYEVQFYGTEQSIYSSEQQDRCGKIRPWYACCCPDWRPARSMLF